MSAERNELVDALLSMDRKRIEPFFQEAMGRLPSNDEAFWGAVHKARLYLDITGAEKEKSRQWLRDHKMQCGIEEDRR